MSEDELLWLAEAAQEHKLIVEIGSYVGRSTRALCDHTPGKVLAIDDWIGPRELQPIGPDILSTIFHQNLEDHIKTGRCIPFRADHGRLDIEISPDMVFIDGGHDYVSASDDIRRWLPKIPSGGLLCGHDFDDGFPGVVQAVNELIPNFYCPAGSIWAAVLT